MTSTVATLAACRFVQGVAVLLLWGTSAYLVCLVPGRLASALAGRLRVGGGAAAAWVWAPRAVAAVLLLAASFAPPRPRLAGTGGAAALMLVGLGLRGHAVVQEGWLGAVHRMSDALHVLSAGAWFGALVPVLLLLPRLARSEERADANLALRRFSRAPVISPWRSCS